MVAGVSGVVLFIVMFFPWYRWRLRRRVRRGASENANAWQAFGFIDILLLLVVLVAVGIAGGPGSGCHAGSCRSPPADRRGRRRAGAGADHLFRILSIPGAGPSDIDGSGLRSTKIGIFLGFLAAAESPSAATRR